MNQAIEPPGIVERGETGNRMKQPSAKKSQRLQLLVKAVGQHGSLHLKDAAKLLKVSEMTVRRDLTGDDTLAYLGGYIVTGNAISAHGDYSLRKESDRHAALKEAACLEALRQIEEEDVLFIDCGTTTPHLARHMPTDKRLTIVCYALNIADILCKKPNLQVILLGGNYHPASATFASEDALRSLDKLHITKAFITAGGIHAERGVSCSHFHEVNVKRAVMANAMKKFAVVDSSKFGKVKLAHFASLDEFDAVITDTHISADDIEAIRKTGPEVLTGKSKSGGKPA